MIKYIKSLFWNLWQIEDGLENFFFFSQNKSYLKDYLIPCDNLRTYLTRSSTQKRIKIFPAKTKTFESSFFPYCATVLRHGEIFVRNLEI